MSIALRVVGLAFVLLLAGAAAHDPLPPSPLVSLHQHQEQQRAIFMLAIGAAILGFFLGLSF